MHRLAALLVAPLLIIALDPATAVGGTLHTGQVQTHHYGGPSELDSFNPRRPLDSMGQPCPEDIFYVKATLRLVDANATEAIIMTTDHAAVPPAAIATATQPGSLVVKLGGCDRGFDAYLTGLASLDGTQYELTFN